MTGHHTCAVAQVKVILAAVQNVAEKQMLIARFAPCVVDLEHTAYTLNANPKPYKP